MEVVVQFNTEKELADKVLENEEFLSIFSSKKSYMHLEKELTGLFGIPDVVIINYNSSGNTFRLTNSFAFELKLSNWKKALSQAFKYKAFANYSYVIIDNSKANQAIKNINYFEKSNIGLISVDIDGNMNIHYKPKYEIPFSDQLRTTLKKTVLERF